MPIPAGYVRKHFGLRPDYDEAFKALVSWEREERGTSVTQSTLIIEAIQGLPGFKMALEAVQNKRNQEAAAPIDGGN